MCVQIQSCWWLPLENTPSFSAGNDLVGPSETKSVSEIAGAVNPCACFSLPPSSSAENIVKCFKGFYRSCTFQGNWTQVLAIDIPYTLPVLSGLGK